MRLHEKIGHYDLFMFKIRIWTEGELPMSVTELLRDWEKGKLLDERAVADFLLEKTGANAIEVMLGPVGIVAYKEWP